MECPICYELYDNGVQLVCDHGCCVQCFEKLITKNQLTCPLCRHNINYYYFNNEKVRILIINKIKYIIPQINIQIYRNVIKYSSLSFISGFFLKWILSKVYT